MTETTNNRLPLLKLILGAGVFAYEKRFVLARSLWLPFLIGMTLSFADSLGVKIIGDGNESGAGLVLKRVATALCCLSLPACFSLQ